MTIASIILEARRVLGDTAGQRWSNERMLDIANRGMRDIARHASMYRAETVIELMRGRYRYPLPTDVLRVTSLSLNGIDLPILSKLDRPTKTFASKDQINLGVLELMPIPTEKTARRMFSGAVSAEGSADPLDGVAANPVSSMFGVTSGLSLDLDESNNSPYGIVTGVAIKSSGISIKSNMGNTYGVVVGIIAPKGTPIDKGGFHQTLDTMRLVGRYGASASVTTTAESVHVWYKALPPKIQALDQAFPLGPQWEDLMVDWLIGTALQDDNDAGNQQRSQTFMQRYVRNLDLASADSSVDYNDSPNVVQYTGGIVKPNRKNRRR